jgi:ribonuclease inhibitor
MNVITINGNLIQTEKDFHKAMKDFLELPDYYGENLDALWDCLTTLTNLPLTIIWTDFDKSRGYLGKWGDKVIDFFNEAESSINGFHIEYR